MSGIGTGRVNVLQIIKLTVSDFDHTNIHNQIKFPNYSLVPTNHVIIWKPNSYTILTYFRPVFLLCTP